MTSFARFETSLGVCAVAWADDGARGITSIFLPDASEASTIARITRRFPGADESAPPSAIRAAIDDITRHLGGAARNALEHVVLDVSASPPFHQKVFAAARAIPPGETRSYGEIATLLGDPGAARAVGQAMAKNPFPIVVPCHRVLAAGKSAGGFSAYGGTITKAKILALEGVVLEPAPPKHDRDSAPLFAGAGALPYDHVTASRHLVSKDKKLAALIEKVGPFALKLEETQGTFAALAESIVYQQLTGKAAATIFGRVQALFPRKRLSPDALLLMPEASLRTAGLSNGKTLALKDLAAKTVDGTVPTLATLAKMSDDAIVERLTCVRGIGRWTVEMLLIFRLGRPDVLPVDDYGVRKGFARAYRKKELPTPKELAAFGERWRPFRTIASWYLWRATELE